MDITYSDWSLSVDLMGGRISSLTHNGVKVFGTYNRIDGKVGNSHLCLPSFDKEGQEAYGLPFHGLVRTLPWSVKEQTSSTLIIRCETRASVLYPADLSIEQGFNLEGDFAHSVKVTHIGGERVPLNIGYHYYWDTPQGWNQLKIKNQSQQNAIETNGYLDLQEINRIQFPHGNYDLTSYGFRSAVLWSSFLIGEGGVKKYSQDFCCIEPVVGWPNYFGSEPSILHPGKTFFASIGIKKVV